MKIDLNHKEVESKGLRRDLTITQEEADSLRLEVQRKKAEAKCFKRFKLNGKVENGKSAQRDSDSKEEEANGLRLSLKEKKRTSLEIIIGS